MLKACDSVLWSVGMYLNKDILRKHTRAADIICKLDGNLNFETQAFMSGWSCVSLVPRLLSLAV